MHNVETMAWTGMTPWHGLGVEVAGNLTPAEIAEAAGINWTLEKRPCFTLDNAGQFMNIPDRFALSRMTDGRVLDTVGKLYKPVQPVEAIEFFQKFVAAGDMTMETAGSLDGGRRIWALAKIKDGGITLKGGDQIDGYLLLCSPNIQGEAFTVKYTKVRVVCENTIVLALNGKGAYWRMSHTKEFNQNMKDAAAEALGLAAEKASIFNETASFLADSKIREQQRLIEYVAALSGSKVLDSAIEEAEGEATGSVLDSIMLATETSQTVRAVRDTDLNKIGRTILESILTSPGSDLPSARNTWWGAVNGVTHAVDHQLGRTADSRLNSAWFGQRALLKNKAVELAVQYAVNNN